jgi:hypothetical protein
MAELLPPLEARVHNDDNTDTIQVRLQKQQDD